jgi:hypothetical protein
MNAWQHPRNHFADCGLCGLKEFHMRIIFVVMLASVLSILAFKYVDRSIGESDLMASPMDMSAEN